MRTRERHTIMTASRTRNAQPTRARRTVAAAPTPRKATTAKVAAPVETADFSALMGAAKKVTAMPKRTRGNGGGTNNPFAPALTQSMEDGQPVELPAVASDDIAKTVILGIRRAARYLGIGVSIAQETDANGAIVITFIGKAKRENGNGDDAAAPAAKKAPAAAAKSTPAKRAAKK